MMEFNEEFNNGDVMAANPNSFTESFPIADQNTVLKRVFKWMALGLTISAVSAFAGLFGIVYMVSAGLGNIAEILMWILLNRRINQKQSKQLGNLFSDGTLGDYYCRSC